MQELKVGQVNAMRSASVLHELRKMAEELDLDVLCVQEPYTRGGSIPGMPVTSRICTIGEQPMAAIITFNPTVTAVVIRHLSDSHCVCMEITKGRERWIVANLYFQFADDIEPYLRQITDIANTNEQSQIIITADANAKSELWHSGSRDERGESLEELIQELQLEIVNQPGQPPTFHNRAGAQSNIDVTLTNGRGYPKVHNWRVLDNTTTSDHNLICFELCDRSDSAQATPTQMPIKYNLNKANWDLLRNVFNPPDPIQPGQDINAYTKDLTKRIQTAMRRTIPIKKTRTRVTNNAWTDELTILRAETRKARKRYQRTFVHDDRQRLLQTYRDKKLQYQQLLFQTKITSWQRFVERHLEVDPWGTPYKLASRKIRSPTTLSTMEREDGSMTSGWEDSAELLLRTLLPDDDPTNEDDTHRQLKTVLTTKYDNSESAAEFSEDEIHHQICKLKTKKSPGSDGIPPEVIKQLAESLTTPLMSLYNECLREGKVPNVWKQADVVIIKKGPDKKDTAPSSYRPICLLNVMGKIQERLLMDRLTEHRTNTIGLHERQFGYRRGRSTEDAINAATGTVHACDRKYALGLFIDFTGAFDNLWWPTLLKRLQDINCPYNLYKSIKNYCQDRYANMTSQDTTISKKISKGCPQGSVCGPHFWDLVIEQLLVQLDDDPGVLEHIAYADDVLVIFSANSRAELETRTNNTLNTIQNWTKQMKLKLSSTKTTYVLFKGSLKRDPTIKVGNQLIKRSKHAKYLGVTLDERLNFIRHIDVTTAKSRAAMQSIASIAQREYKLPLKTIKIYLNSILASIMGHAASSWAHRLHQNKTLRDKVDAVQRSILVRMTGSFRTTSGDALNVVVGILPLHLEITRRAALYWLRKGREDKILELLPTSVHSKRDIAEVILDRWQQQWNESTKGRRVHNILPNVRQRLELHHLAPSQGLIHFLTGHGPYPTHLARMNLKTDDLCDCGETGTPEHAILRCRLFDVPERNELQDVTLQDALQDADLVHKLNKLTQTYSNEQKQKHNLNQQRH